MQAAKQADRAGASLQFGLQAGEPGTILGNLIVDRAFKSLEHLVAHLLCLFDRTRLRRPEQHLLSLRTTGGD